MSDYEKKLINPESIELLISSKIDDRDKRVRQKLEKMRDDAFRSFVRMQVDLTIKLDDTMYNNVIAYHKSNCITESSTCELEFIKSFLILFNIEIANRRDAFEKWGNHDL